MVGIFQKPVLAFLIVGGKKSFIVHIFQIKVTVQYSARGSVWMLFLKWLMKPYETRVITGLDPGCWNYLQLTFWNKSSYTDRI